MTDIFALTTRGLESTSAREMASVPGVSVTQVAYRRVAAACTGPLGPLLGLRTVDDVFLDVATWRGIGRPRRALATLHGLSFRGLALADSAKQVAHAAILYVLLRRWQGRIEGLEVRGAIGKVAGAGLAMALFCFGALRLAGTPWTTGTLHLLAFVVSTSGAGVILYLLLLYWWDVPELTLMVNRVRVVGGRR